MTAQEHRWFDKLHRDRADSANMLEKPSMRGVQRSVVDKYSDQAHFIYELLQNADDVKATTARFRLEKDGLFFIHDGAVPFTVSDPDTEDADTPNGKLGHVNAITSIANSNKTTASIGKFGVGFKAVFQHTKTPHVYDPQFRFKIERFIVPVLLNDDLEWREPSETVFWFPFDHENKAPVESFDEILLKFKALDYPSLFLSHLELVTFEANGTVGTYTKKVEAPSQHGNMTVQRLALSLDINDEVTTDRMLIFSRRGPAKLPYSIGFALDDDGKLKPIDRPAFCFFPTKESTNLEFVIHAPFLLTDSREGIKAGEKHNQDLVQQLAHLAADSMPILRDQGLIDDGLFDIIPYDESKFSALEDRRKLSFKPFFSAIKTMLQTDALLPAADGCSTKSRSYWASDTELVELFSDEQLAALTGTKDARWILRTRGKKEVQNANRELADYIDGADARTYPFRAPNLIAASLDPQAVLRKITADFIALQSHDWLHKLYGYLSERKSYQQTVKQSAIFIDREGNAVPAFDGKNQLVLFLPDDEIEGYTTIHPVLLQQKATREFVETFGVKKPSLRDEIYNRILPACQSDGEIDTGCHFLMFFKYFRECKNEEVTDFIGLIKDREFVLYSSCDDPVVYRGKASDLYFPTSDLRAWFEPKPDTRFVALDEYHGMIAESDHEILDKFLERLGVNRRPRVLSRAISRSETAQQGRNHEFKEWFLDGSEELIAAINPDRSLLLWRTLSAQSDITKTLKGVHTWFFYKPRVEHSLSTDQRRLLGAEWLLTRDGELACAQRVTIQSLSDQYDLQSTGARALIGFLEIHDETIDTAHLSEDEARKIRLAEELERSGLSDDEIRDAVAEAKRKKSGHVEHELAGDGDTPASDSPLIRDIQQRRPSAKKTPSSEHPGASWSESEDAVQDADDFSPKSIDFTKKLERAKDRQASELDRIELEQALYEKAKSLPRYSYGWFLALLELESMASTEKSSDAKTISIRFGKVERDGHSARTVVLKEPSRFVPQSIEELSSAIHRRALRRACRSRL